MFSASLLMQHRQKLRKDLKSYLRKMRSSLDLLIRYRANFLLTKLWMPFWILLIISSAADAWFLTAVSMVARRIWYSHVRSNPTALSLMKTRGHVVITATFEREKDFKICMMMV